MVVGGVGNHNVVNGLMVVTDFVRAAILLFLECYSKVYAV